MKAFEISGTRGTYLELEDGRFSNTVDGTGADLDKLRAEVTEYVSLPVCTEVPVERLAEYVGAA